MIKITIQTDKTFSGFRYYKKISIDGHAISNTEGTNAVLCASVSSLTVFVSNMIKFLNLNNLVEVEISSGHFEIKAKDYNSTINSVLDNLNYSLESLKEQHPSYLSIESIVSNTKEDDLLKEKELSYEDSLLILGSTTLSYPVQPHISLSDDEINKVQKAYKVLESALAELRELKLNKGN